MHQPSPQQASFPPAGSEQAFLPTLLLAHGLFLLLNLLLAQDTPHGSLLVAIVAGFVPIVVIGKCSLNALLTRSVLYILLLAYSCRVGIGAVHYLSLIDPGYFNNPEWFGYDWEQQWMHESMKLVSETWWRYGFMSPLPDWYWEQNKNPVLLAYNALLYFTAGTFVLNLAVWNSLHSIYTAAIVGILAIKIGCTSKQAARAVGIAAFQPFGMISSTFIRDFVGQTWVAIAVIIIVLNATRPARLLILVPLASFLAYCQRQPYLALIPVGTILVLCLSGTPSRIGPRYLVPAAIFTFIIVAWQLFSDLAFGRFADKSFVGLDRVLVFPLLLLRGLLGPFPWFQIFDLPGGWEYMIGDFPQVLLNFAVFAICTRVAIVEWRKAQHMNSGLVFGLLFFLSGCFAAGVHVTYTSIGTIFLYPVVAMSSMRNLIGHLTLGAAFFTVANVLYWSVGLYGSGALMRITGY